MTDTEKAYIAGIIDGEGSIGIRKHIYKTGAHNNPGYGVYVEVRMTDKQPIEYLINICGGNLLTKGITKKGKVVFDWKIYGNNAISFLREIYPYLKCKHRQAKTAISYSSLPNMTRSNSDWLNRQREARRNIISILNRTGHSISC